MTDKWISAAELDAKFDAGEDIEEFIDFATMHRPGQGERIVSVKLTREMVNSIDQGAAKAKTSREALVAQWVSERLDAENLDRAA